MAKSYVRVKFPCGYELEYFVETYALIVDITDKDESLKLCPLHGKNCKSNKK